MSEHVGRYFDVRLLARRLHPVTHKLIPQRRVPVEKEMVGGACAPFGQVRFERGADALRQVKSAVFQPLAASND